MTTISTDDVKHLASLSALSLSDDEIQSLRGDIEAILGYVEQLNTLDTTGVEPTYQVTGLENVWRTDTVQESGVETETLLGLAADSHDQQFKVPKVL